MRAARQDTAVSARDLSIYYRPNGLPSVYVAVRGVTFDIARGEFLGLVGESGSGKSTLARTLAGGARRRSGLDGVPEICGGSLTVLGASMRRAYKRRRDRVTIGIGYLAQDGAERFNPRLTASENVAEPIYRRDRRFPRREAMIAVASVIDAVHLPLSVMERLPYELSSGQRQRVALARALVLEPQLLIADEPARGVDALVRDGVFDTLERYRTEHNMAGLIVSSRLMDVTNATTRLAVMQHGVIVGLGAAQEVLSSPDHPYLKDLAQQYTSVSQQKGSSVG